MWLSEVLSVVFFVGVPAGVGGLLLVVHWVDSHRDCGTRLESMLLADVSVISLFILFVFLKKRGWLVWFVQDPEQALSKVLRWLAVFFLCENASLAASLVAHWIGCNGKKQRWILVVDSVLALAMGALTSVIGYIVINEDMLSDFKQSRHRYRAVERVCRWATQSGSDGPRREAVLQMVDCFPSSQPPAQPSINSLYILFVRARYSLVVRDAAGMSQLFAEFGRFGCARTAVCPVCEAELVPGSLLSVYPCCLEVSHGSCFSRNADCGSCSSGSVTANLRNADFLQRLDSQQRLTEASLFDLMKQRFGHRHTHQLDWR